MTILAGAFARRARARLPQTLCATLRGTVSRDSRDEPVEFHDGRVLMLKVDIGAYECPAVHHAADGSVSMLAGEPLIAGGGRDRARSQDLVLLHQGLSRGSRDLAASTRGVFAVAHYQPATPDGVLGPTVTLLTDRLGIRPLYYWMNADYLVWASALRILEAVRDIPHHMDARAVAELACLGVPLATRTPYHGVHLLSAAEVLSVGPTHVERARHWRWDDVRLSDRPARDLLRRMQDRFREAVACRVHRDTSTTAFLSGGLDSRTVVAVLRDSGLGVRTMCFGLRGTQDQALAAAFARVVGTEHHDAPMRPEFEVHFVQLMAAALAELSRSDTLPQPTRPRLVWSGDGGSMPLGHIYLTAEMVDRLRQGDQGAAIDAYLRQQGAFVSRRLLQPDVGRSLAALLREGIAEELGDLHGDDPGRGLYLFLLLNDQRRHLAAHFEDIDRTRLELQLPFYDGEFLSAVMETRIDWGLEHRLYLDWLRLLPPVITSVPWQTYPGHLPCPLPLPEGARYQWDLSRYRDIRRSRKLPLLRRAHQLLSAAAFPSELLRRGRLRLATWLYQAGLADYGYVIRQAGLFYKYWDRCGGRWVVPEPPADSGPTTQRRHLATAEV